MEGKKYDKEKLRWSLLPIDAVEKIVEVLQFGSKKYEDDNWKKVQPYDERYFNACMRHLVAWKQKEKYDKETGYNHLAHAGACILFMLWNEECLNGKAKKE
jgi:hypothetical protein